MIKNEVVEIAELGLSLFDRITKWKNSKLDTKAKLRLLYAECYRNLVILEAIRLNEFSAKKDLHALQKIFNQLDIQVLELIFLEGEENQKLYKLINKIKLEKEDDKADKLSVSDFSILLNKIKLMLKMASIGNNKLLANTRFKVRINNIKKLLFAITSGIKKYDGVLK